MNDRTPPAAANLDKLMPSMFERISALEDRWPHFLHGLECRLNLTAEQSKALSNAIADRLDRIDRDLEEHDRHIGRCDEADAAQKREIAAQESRIHALEQKTESLDAASCGAIQRLSDHCDFLTQRFDDVFVALRSRGIGISDFGTEARARGIPKHGLPIGTGLIDVPEVVPQTREEIRESHAVHFEGMGGQ